MSDPVQPASVYDLSHTDAPESRATFAVLVDNEPGVLHRVVGEQATRLDPADRGHSGCATPERGAADLADAMRGVLVPPR